MSKGTPQIIVTVALIALFAFAYFKNTDDEMFKGALIAAFSAAYGYWLGSSSGSKQNGDIVRQIAAQPSVTATGANPTINASSTAEERSLEDPA